MKLSKIISGEQILNDISDILNMEIDELSCMSQNQMKNALFFCYDGNSNGHELSNSAKQNGAIALVVERFVDTDLPQILVKSSRKAMAKFAQNFFQTQDFKVIGITGTNGKTTTSFLIQEIMAKAGIEAGVIGTQGVFFKGKSLPATLTTPDPITLHEIFSIMKNAGLMYAIMEVSAHAIALEKISGIEFESKVITNISQDHLDFFKTMENYAKTKLDFMSSGKNRIINVDDPRLMGFIEDDDVKTYAINNPSHAFAVEINRDCSKYVMNINDNIINVETHLYGIFNVYNVLAASLCCLSLGIKVGHIVEALQSFRGVSGRFNVFSLKNDNKVIVDFAHTPDGLFNVLKTARAITDGKLYVVFGCGGNRDRTKRAKMGEIAEKLCDFCFITVDNPRFENPVDILSDILGGMKTKNFLYQDDRAKAIEMAIDKLKENDTVIICGKGGENYIDIKGVKKPYSDFVEVQKNIKRLL